MKTKPMTASELKFQHNQNPGEHYFFDREAMKFFGDTMKNYYVPRATVFVERPSGGIVECYELQRRRPVKHGLQDSAYFSTKTFERVLGGQK